ncbi:MAG: transporter ATP-binding protein [Actinomycetia bacterium]|nr:transporter ATP-binding protein [Actinomycetes bacterium]
MITVNGLSKTYQRHRGDDHLRVLNGISFELNDGEFLGIIGPSGCGKTTLLKILAGLSSHDGGEIRVNGVPLTGPGPDRRMVFQDFALLPWRTVTGNIEFGLENRGLVKKERQRRVEEALAMTGLTNFAKYYPYQLSGGMKQRVGVARALVVGPDTLLMDEPFGALDAQTRRVLQEDILRLMEGTGKSVVLVTHDMDEAVLLCDRIIVMAAHPGRIVEEIDTTAALPRPRRGRVDDVKALPEYPQLVNRIWSLLATHGGSGPAGEVGIARERAEHDGPAGGGAVADEPQGSTAR